MRKTIAQAVAAVAIIGASLAAYVHPSSAALPQSLADAAARTAKQSSLAFELTVQIGTVGKLPYALHAKGALGGARSLVALKVADVHLSNGRVVTGPSAIEQTDGTFLYLRGTVTQPIVGALWIREPLTALSPASPELRLLNALSPRALLHALGRAEHLRSSDGGRVFHASLPYDDPLVAGTLSSLESNTQYRNLRVTAWVSPQGKVLMLLLSGRTADQTSTFLLSATFGRFGKPVQLTLPRASSFVDFNLSRLPA